MWVRGIDYREAGKRLPMWITCWSVKVREEEMLSEPRDIWHDSPFYCNLEAEDGETIDIFVAWSPYHCFISH